MSFFVTWSRLLFITMIDLIFLSHNSTKKFWKWVWLSFYGLLSLSWTAFWNLKHTPKFFVLQWPFSLALCPRNILSWSKLSWYLLYFSVRLHFFEHPISIIWTIFSIEIWNLRTYLIRFFSTCYHWTLIFVIFSVWWCVR